MFGKEVAVPVAATPMELIQRAVDNNIDVDKIEKLMDLQERYIANLSKQSFNAAVAQFQGECPPIPCTEAVKNKSGGVIYRYAPLDKVQSFIQPHMAAAGLAVRFSTRMETDGYLTAICYVMHADGHTEESEFTCPADKELRVNDSQRQGSANSYAKRYALSNALNLVYEKEDDDGQAGGTVTVTADQAIEIEELIKEKKIDVPAFFKWVGCNSFDTIPANMYDRIKAEYK